MFSVISALEDRTPGLKSVKISDILSMDIASIRLSRESQKEFFLNPSTAIIDLQLNPTDSD
jgi:hypothetical protein